MNIPEKFSDQWKLYTDNEHEDGFEEDIHENSSLVFEGHSYIREEKMPSEVLGSIFYASKKTNPQYARLKNVQQRVFSEDMNNAIKKLIRYKEGVVLLENLLDPERLEYSLRIASHIVDDIKNIELPYYILALYEINYFLDTNSTLDRQTFLMIEEQIGHSHFNQRYMHILAQIVRDLYINNTSALDFTYPEIKLVSVKIREYLSNYREIFTQQFKIKHSTENLLNKYFDAQSGLFFCKLMIIATITNELQKVSYKLYRQELQAEILTPLLISKLTDLIREKLLINKNITVKSPLYFILALLKYFDRQLFIDYISKLSVKPQTHNIANLERHKDFFEECKQNILTN